MRFLSKSAEGSTVELNGRDVTIDRINVGLGTAEVTLPDGSTKTVGLDKF
jgi:hypothetical protein